MSNYYQTSLLGSLPEPLYPLGDPGYPFSSQSHLFQTLSPPQPGNHLHHPTRQQQQQQQGGGSSSSRRAGMMNATTQETDGVVVDNLPNGVNAGAPTNGAALTAATDGRFVSGSVVVGGNGGGNGAGGRSHQFEQQQQGMPLLSQQQQQQLQLQAQQQQTRQQTSTQVLSQSQQQQQQQQQKLSPLLQASPNYYQFPGIYGNPAAAKNISEIHRSQLLQAQQYQAAHPFQQLIPFTVPLQGAPLGLPSVSSQFSPQPRLPLTNPYPDPYHAYQQRPQEQHHMGHQLYPLSHPPFFFENPSSLNPFPVLSFDNPDAALLTSSATPSSSHPSSIAQTSTKLGNATSATPRAAGQIPAKSHPQHANSAPLGRNSLYPHQTGSDEDSLSDEQEDQQQQVKHIDFSEEAGGTPQDTKRRHRHPERWIKNVKKRERATNHQLGANCHCKRFRCFDEKTTETQRIALIKYFNDLADYNKQQGYLSALIEATSTPEEIDGPDAEIKETKGGKKRHSYSSKYYVMVEKAPVRVCQKAFCSIFGITAQRVNLLTSKVFKYGVEGTPMDLRGKHTNRGKRTSKLVSPPDSPKDSEEDPSPTKTEPADLSNHGPTISFSGEDQGDYQGEQAHSQLNLALANSPLSRLHHHHHHHHHHPQFESSSLPFPFSSVAGFQVAQQNNPAYRPSLPGVNSMTADHSNFSKLNNAHDPRGAP